MTAPEPEPLPFAKKLAYAVGQLGWSLGSYTAMYLLVYFYMPPEEGGEDVFPPRIYQGAVLGLFTIIGVVFGLGRLFDAVTDPLIASWSDRSRSRFGRRRFFLAVAVVPFTVCSCLIFMPPVAADNWINTVWLVVAILLFYFFFTLYVTPYFAWLNELGHSENERLLLSTLISITWAIGFVIGSQAIGLQAYFEEYTDPMTAFQWVVILFAIVSAALMLVPILTIDERRYCRAAASTEGAVQALRGALKNRNFRVFVLSDLAYWAALVFYTTGLLYYITVLARLDKAVYSHLMAYAFVLSFLFYVPVGLLAQRFGKKRMLLVAFCLFCLSFLFVVLVGKLPFAPLAQAYILATLGALPLAIFGILPNAMVADMAEADGLTTGNFKAAVFFGARPSCQRWAK